MPEHAADLRWPQSRAELARRHGVHVSAITRALERAVAAHAADPAAPAPPAPVNPGQPQPRYLPAEFDPWWATRPRRGRPPRSKEGAGGDGQPAVSDL